MIRFGCAGSINLYDKHSAVVLFATFLCRGKSTKESGKISCRGKHEMLT